jgi:hypothetical protein
MTYPKMLYRSDTQFSDEEGLKAGLAPGGSVRKQVVESEEAEVAAVDAGWSESPMDFIGSADAAAAPDAAPGGRRKKAAAE